MGERERRKIVPEELLFSSLSSPPLNLVTHMAKEAINHYIGADPSPGLPVASYQTANPHS